VLRRERNDDGRVLRSLAFVDGGRIREHEPSNSSKPYTTSRPSNVTMSSEFLETVTQF
jgi:hypothetical protein